MKVEMMYKGPTGKNMTGEADIDEYTISRIIPSQDGKDSYIVFTDGDGITVSGEVSVVSKAWRKALRSSGDAEEALGQIWGILGEYMLDNDLEDDDECEE